MKLPFKDIIKEYLLAVTIAAVTALFIRSFVTEAFRIPTDFMAPTLLPGDHIFVNKIAYQNIFGKWTSRPQPGDVVVFTLPIDPKHEYIKRVVAVAGDTVEIKDEKLLINNKPVTQPGATNTGMQNLDPIHVTDGMLFVLGDNRSKGQDSRSWGLLSIESVKGRASIVWFSMGSSGAHDPWRIRWERIFKRVK